ncbi:MAG: uroporphyrinogen-III synthase [Marinosulfonomonas sp.]|nr:uroporphyrinogen-III synthase [Marinosulfonomonas sp.]
MPDPSPIIILTRPIHQGEAFRDLLGPDAQVIVSPVLEIRQIPVDRELKNYDALIFTSRNAVAAAANSFDLRGLKAFVVGEKTAEQARLRGVSVIGLAQDADVLVGVIRAALPNGKLLHIRGRYTAGDIQGKLVLVGIETDYCVCYEQNAYPLSSAAKDSLTSHASVVLPLFSPRSAAVLSADLQELQVKAEITLVAISKATLSAWKGPDPVQSVVAQTPDGQAMLQEILRLIG